MQLHYICCGQLYFTNTHFCRNFLFVLVKESVLSVSGNQALEIKASNLSDQSHMRQIELERLPIIQSVNNMNISHVFHKSKENLNHI